MQRNDWISRTAWLGAAVLVLASAAGVLAQGPTDPPRRPDSSPTSPTQGAIDFLRSAATPLGTHWLGITWYPVPPALRAQLNLPENQGLVVEEVVPDGPAAKAVIKPFDILMKAGDKPLKDIRDLAQAVDGSKDKEMTLEILRGGKSLKIKVTPTRRPEGEAAMGPMNRPDESDWTALNKWLDLTRQRMARMRQGLEEKRQDMERMRQGWDERRQDMEQPWRFHFYHPGAILPPGASVQAPLPGNTTISITKKGNEPARIVVTRDKDKWEVTEKDLGKLPADLRPHVERMLGRGLLGGQAGGGVMFHVAPGPRDTGKSEASKAQPDGPRAATPSDRPGPRLERRLEDRLEKRLDEMNRRIEQLFKSLDEMREHRPGKAPQKPHEEKPGEKI